jgi:calcium-dependent protein kinase
MQWATALQGVFEDEHSIHLVMELCTGGGILDRMNEGTLTEARVAAIIRSVLRFIAQCHAKGIIYRDVKPDNFLFLTPDEDSPIRATDFGLSIR